MRTFVVVGCLVACFLAVESRTLNALESNTAQVAQVAQSFTADQIASAPQQLSFQGQSDELKQDKGKKGKSGDWYYPGYEHPGYPWQYGYPYGHHSTYPYRYHYPYQHLPLPAATLPPSHPAVHVQGPVVVSHPAQQPYPYPYHYPYHYQYPYNYPCHYGYNCGYPYGYAVPAPAETKEENRKEEKNGSKEKEDDKKSKINH